MSEGYTAVEPLANACIVLFTRSRPGCLERAVRHAASTGLPVLILDDSPEQLARGVLSGCASYVLLFDRVSQQEFLKNLPSSAEIHSLVRLGRHAWNLGSARSFGLLLGRSLGFEMVLFCDDDIEYTGEWSHFISEVREHGCVGATIAGKPDYSVLDHIAVQAGQRMDDGPCGGLLGFRPIDTTHYFLNVYNEDLLWMSLHPGFRTAPTVGVANQVHKDCHHDLRSLTEKAEWQEYGELLLRGLASVDFNDPFYLLTKREYWEDVILDERAAVAKIAASGAISVEQKAICERVLVLLGKFAATEIVREWQSYALTSERWTEYMSRVGGSVDLEEVAYELA